MIILTDLLWLPVRQLFYRHEIMAFECLTGCHQIQYFQNIFKEQSSLHVPRGSLVVRGTLCIKPPQDKEPISEQLNFGTHWTLPLS